MTALRLEVSAYFWSQLDGIAQHLDAHEAPDAYGRLLDLLEHQVFPNLKRFPKMGRPLLASEGPHSVEGLRALESLPEPWRSRLRQTLVGGYWLLYACDDERLLVLAIRHQRQLSFDLHRHWP